MSRIGKKPIQIPENVEVVIKDRNVLVRGPKGENSVDFLSDVMVEKKENTIVVTPTNTFKNASAFWGLFRALLQNAITGVVSGFEKKLEIRGVGFKAALEGPKKLKLNMGFTHDVFLDIPERLTVQVEKEIITVSGVDKQQVGEFAAKIRDVKKPEPYKGKGIRYVGEVVRKKEGKKAATAK